jgi:hypothetical protein
VAAAADVDDVVAPLGQVLDQVMGDHHVGAGGIDHLQAPLGGARFDRRRDAMRREDDRAALNPVQTLDPVIAVDQLDAAGLELVGHVGVVHQVPEHPDLLSRIGPGRLLGGPNRFHHAVAVATGRDLEDVHPDSSLPTAKTANRRDLLRARHGFHGFWTRRRALRCRRRRGWPRAGNRLARFRRARWRLAGGDAPIRS